MAISDDFTIDYVNKRVYHSSGTTIYTVNALYSYLQDTFDELAQLDDTIPMSAQTPTEYTLINGWFMDDTSYQFLKSGAVKTDGYLNEIRLLTLSSTGYTGAVAGDIGKTVTGGTTGDTGELLAYNNSTYKWWVRMDDSGDLFDDVDEALTIASGTGAGTMGGAASTTGEDLSPNIYTLGTIEEDDDQQIYIVQNATRIHSGSEWWPEAGTQHIDVLVKTKESGVEIDSGKITVFLRHYPSDGNADLYDHFEIDLTAGGRNAVPLATSPDLNNTSAHATVSAYNDITVAWVNGTVAHGAITGTFTNWQAVTWPGGGTGIMLKDSAGTMTLGNVADTASSGHGPQSGETITTATGSASCTGNMVVAKTMTKNFEQGSSYNYSVVINCATHLLSEFYEYTKYISRIGETTFHTYGVKNLTATLSVVKLEGQQYVTPFIDYDTSANTFSPVKAAPYGTFAGGKFFGGRGVWIENMAEADIQNFQLIDSDGSTRTPPNKQSVTISNLLSGDRVAVFRTTSGTIINKAMYTAASGNTAGNTTFVVSEAIAADTPSSGSIRVVDTSDTGATRETRYTYTSWSGSTFSGISPSLDRSYTATSDTAYVPFIDTTASDVTSSVTVIYTADRTIIVRVRRKAATAILPFETTGTFTSSGYSTSAIRTADTIVS